MIDGIKIELPSQTAKLWLSNNLLDFHTYTNVNTGELLDNTIVAKYKGLVFTIIKSLKQVNTYYCYIRGSLHKYYNNGIHNYNDFTLKDLRNVVKELKSKFNIEPKTAILRNLEFGVNINAPIPTSQLLKDLVSYGAYSFGTLTVEGLKVGKTISQQETKLKVYDKGKQYKTGTNNLVRIEIAVKKMRYLKKHNISTINDLLDTPKIKSLGTVLISYWDNIIYYDKKMDYKLLTTFERKKMLYYATPRNWTEFSRMQRTRAKKHFTKLIDKYGSTTQKEISSLIIKKWEHLTSEICIQIIHDKKDLLQQPNVYELSVNIDCENVYKSLPKKNTNILPEKAVKKNLILKPKKMCKECKKDIYHKRAKTKFCSKKCNNAFHGKKRTLTRQRIRKKEIEQLNKLLTTLHKQNIWLAISYKVDEQIFTDTLYQTEIHTTSEWIKTVCNVIVTRDSKNNKPITLTSYRARKIIRLINNLNT